MNKTLVVWWRYGKEHDPAGDSFRVNPPGTVAAHINQKVAAARRTPDADWRWWQVDDELLIERADPNAHHYGPTTRVYYLPQRGLGVIENIHRPAPNERWSWGIHVADTFWDAARASWIMQDLFADILVEASGRVCRVEDLDEVGLALDLGLLSPEQTSTVLRTTDAALRAIEAGEFPFPEIVRAREACRELGWDRPTKA